MQERVLLTEIFKNVGLSEIDFATVISSFERKELKKNDFVLQEHKVCSEYYFIETGFMRSFAVDTKGNEITTAFYSRAQIVWEASSFLLRIPAKENIQALTDVACWSIGFDKFQTLFNGIPAFRDQGRARLVADYFALKKKSLSMITDSAEARYLQLLKEHPEIIQQAPLKYIATYLGITDTSLSRIRKELSKKK